MKTNDLASIFTECVFDGPPPSPYETWKEWANESPHKGVRISALEPKAAALIDRINKNAVFDGNSITAD